MRYDDISENVVHICKTIEMNEWIEREPKFRNASRYIALPEHVIRLIGNGEDRIIDMTPAMLMRKFHRALASAGIKGFSFAMLRRHHATIMKIIDISREG